MKIKQIISSDKFSEDNDYRNLLCIEIDGKKQFYFLDGEPEDANLSRDFNDCFRIVAILIKAYNAGKNGEKLEITEETTDTFI